MKPAPTLLCIAAEDEELEPAAEPVADAADEEPAAVLEPDADDAALEAPVWEAGAEEPLAPAAVEAAPVDAEALKQAVLDEDWMVNWPERPVAPVLSIMTSANS